MFCHWKEVSSHYSWQICLDIKSSDDRRWIKINPCCLYQYIRRENSMGIVKCNSVQHLCLWAVLLWFQSHIGKAATIPGALLPFYVQTLKETLDNYGMVLGHMYHITWVSGQLVSVQVYFRWCFIPVLFLSPNSWYLMSAFFNSAACFIFLCIDFSRLYVT